jgi:hypothetical protein
MFVEETTRDQGDQGENRVAGLKQMRSWPEVCCPQSDALLRVSRLRAAH